MGAGCCISDSKRAASRPALEQGAFTPPPPSRRFLSSPSSPRSPTGGHPTSPIHKWRISSKGARVRASGSTNRHPPSAFRAPPPPPSGATTRPAPTASCQLRLRLQRLCNRRLLFPKCSLPCVQQVLQALAALPPVQQGWAESGGGGVWDPKVCVPKMARPDFPDCKFRFFPRLSLCSGGGGGFSECSCADVCLLFVTSTPHVSVWG